MSGQPEIITIINNSGKVISTGKQLLNIFKEAQATYRERKEASKAERAGIQRSKTFDVTPRSGPGLGDNHAYPYDEYTPQHAAPPSGFDDQREYTYDDRNRGIPLQIRDRERRRSHEDDDGRSNVSRQSASRSKRMSALPAPPAGSKSVALTMENLKTHSEVSSTAPSKAPAGYKALLGEGSPRDMQLSRMPCDAPQQQSPARELPVPPPPGPGHLVRSRTEPVMITKKKSIDMDLAYGSIPPDLQHRHDLEPREVIVTNRGGVEEEIEPEEAAALGLMDKIEDFLEEAQCVHASATNMIETLQQKPEAAAAVALSLAELSALLGKMSPAFLAFLKGGSPAVFALLASPQFLIGTGIAAGITVVMFGGWKIVKRMALGQSQARQKMMEQPIAMRAVPSTEVGAASAQQQQHEQQAGAQSQASYDEALVLEDVEELSSIECWRRGIQVGGLEDAETTVEMELMSPEADRMLTERQKWKEFMSSMGDDDEELDPSDSISQVGRSARSYKSYKSYQSKKHGSSKLGRVSEVPERKSSRDERSVAGSERSGHRSHRDRERKDRDRDAESSVSHRSERRDRERDRDAESSVSHRSHRERRDKEDRDDGVSVAGSERSTRSHRDRREREREREKSDGKDDEVSVAGSERSTRSHRSSRSHRDRDRDSDAGSNVSRSSTKYYSSSSKVGATIKEEEVDEENDKEGGAGKIKKPNMLKQLFKRKKEKEEKEGKALSVMI